MRARLSTIFAFLLILLAAPILPARAQEMQFDTSALIRHLLPTVVNVTSVLPQRPPPAQEAGSAAASPQSQQESLLGSGFVIAPDGEIATNYHVIDGAVRIIVTFSDGSQADAKVLAADRLADIALLQVQVPHKLQAIRWGDSHTVHVGDPVIAIGNPLGVGLSVTGGIVSAVNRNIQETPYDNYIQTDAPINHGNSGGPLFNMSGDVVGINTAIISPTAASAGLGFAIPSGDARFVIGQLQRYGWLNPGWIGIKVQQVTPDMANALGLPEPRGSIVADVVAGGPAEAAGLEVGDIVEGTDGRADMDERAILRSIAETSPGSRITLDLMRGGSKLAVPLKVAEWPKQLWERFDVPIQKVKDQQAIPANLGITVGPLGSSQRVKLGMPPKTPGILVTSVKPGSPAADRGIKAGDAILRVQDETMREPDDFLPAVEAARTQQKHFAMLLTLSQKEVHPGAEWAAVRIAP